MDPVTMLAGANVLSSVGSGLFGRSSANDAMKYQMRMANTQYRRSARDLEAAGLNRILALGSPAPTPSGHTASMPDAKLGDALISATSAKQAIKQSKAQTDFINQQNVESLHKTHLLAEQTKAAAASARSAEAQAYMDEVTKGIYEHIKPMTDEMLNNLSDTGVSGALPYVLGGLLGLTPLGKIGQKGAELGVSGAKGAKQLYKTWRAPKEDKTLASPSKEELKRARDMMIYD